eukprot:c22065_g2_i1 orf=223-1779(+)
MACRALCRSVHRPLRYLLSTRGFLPARNGDQFLAYLHALTPLPKATLHSHFSCQSPFSSSPLLLSNREGEAEDKVAETGVIENLKEDAISSTSISTSEELGADGIVDIPSPMDLMVTCLDTLHNFTGLPWWATISISAVVLRALLFPSRVLQNKKLAEIKKLGPKLQLERLAKGLSQGKFLEEYRHLKKRKQELCCPSLLWIIGPGIFIQVPLVLMIMYSLRKMALEQHLGFITGGFLWFKDLTNPGQGLTGAVLPLVVAATYFANVHVLFQGRPIRQGPLGSLEKAWRKLLQCSTVFIFLSFYHVPQAVHMFFVPHSIMTLSQTLLFENETFSARVVGPKMEDGFQRPTIGQKMITLSSYENLLKDAGTQFTSGNITQAIDLLKNAIKEEPEEEQAYALLGLVYKAQKDWVNSAVYYKHAIVKGKTDDFKMAAYAGCGLALLKEGAVMDCIETLRPIKSFKVPEHPESRHCYYASLVIFGRALLEAGLKEESLEIVQRAKELNGNKSDEAGNISNTL